MRVKMLVKRWQPAGVKNVSSWMLKDVPMKTTIHYTNIGSIIHPEHTSQDAAYLQSHLVTSWLFFNLDQDLLEAASRCK
jgi:hypothetical protein